MKTKAHLYRIADLIGSNLGFDFFDWEKLSGEISHLSYLDDHTLDMIQAQVVQATSIRTEYDLDFDPFPDKIHLLEVVNYFAGLTLKPPPAESKGAREILAQDFASKQIEWGSDFHLLLTITLAFDKSGSDKLEKSVYMLADLGYRALKEGRDSSGS